MIVRQDFLYAERSAVFLACLAFGRLRTAYCYIVKGKCLNKLALKPTSDFGWVWFGVHVKKGKGINSRY